jgi:hypothetical protein
MSEVQRGLLPASIPWDGQKTSFPQWLRNILQTIMSIGGTDIVLLTKDEYLAARAADDQKVDPRQDPEALKANLDYMCNYWSPRLAA